MTDHVVSVVAMHEHQTSVLAALDIDVLPG